MLIHELGGALSSVQGFAHIAAENPAHPDRERFIRLTASEARRAAQTVKDIHLLRSFDRGRIATDPPAVELASVLLEAARLRSGTGLRLVAGNEVMVKADPAKIAGLLARCLDAAVGPCRVAPGRAGTAVVFPIAPASELTRRDEALDAPYPDMVTWAILRRLLRHWGGDVTLAVEGEWTVARAVFAPA